MASPKQHLQQSLQEIHSFSAAYINFGGCELAGKNNTSFSAGRGGPVKIPAKF
jgi:hypothetical protein